MMARPTNTPWRPDRQGAQGSEAILLSTFTESVPAFRLRTIPVVLALAACALLALATPAFAAYDPLAILPDDVYHNSSSMTAAGVQAFLAALPGPLKSLVTTDYAGVAKPASQIIWEAAHEWDLNPQVILATLQKEQSLLTVSNSINAARLLKAMGYGVYGTDPITGKTINRYPGFGQQVWYAAFSLSQGKAISGWYPGKPFTATVSATKATIVIYPKNAPTFELYTYTPYYPQKLFWDVFVQYFGDPDVLKSVHRFRNLQHSYFLFTADEGEKATIIATLSKSWTYEGIAYQVNSLNPLNTSTLWRFRNIKGGFYLFTADAAEKGRIVASYSKTWKLEGPAYGVSLDSSGAPVWRFRNRFNGTYLYTADPAEKNNIVAKLSKSWKLEGPAYFLAP